MVLVTGGAKGIGRMISEGYVASGATVYISSRDAKACEQAVNELNALGKGKAHAIPANFYTEEDCKKLAEELSKRESSTLNCGWPKMPDQCANHPVQSSTSWSTTPAPTGPPPTTNTPPPAGPESSPSTSTASSPLPRCSRQCWNGVRRRVTPRGLSTSEASTGSAFRRRRRLPTAPARLVCTT